MPTRAIITGIITLIIVAALGLGLYLVQQQTRTRSSADSSLAITQIQASCDANGDPRVHLAWSYPGGDATYFSVVREQIGNQSGRTDTDPMAQRATLTPDRRHFNDSGASPSQNARSDDGSQTVIGGTKGLKANTIYRYRIYERYDGSKSSAPADITVPNCANAERYAYCAVDTTVNGQTTAISWGGASTGGAAARLWIRPNAGNNYSPPNPIRVVNQIDAGAGGVQLTNYQLAECNTPGGSSACPTAANRSLTLSNMAPGTYRVFCDIVKESDAYCSSNGFTGPFTCEGNTSGSPSYRTITIQAPPTPTPSPTPTPTPQPPAAPRPPVGGTENHPPVLGTLTINSAKVIPNGTTQYTMTVLTNDLQGATDTTSQYLIINHQGEHAGQHRGYIGWSTENFPDWNNKIKDNRQIDCTGGGKGAVEATLGAQYINLISCATTAVGDTRTVSFVVTFNNTFTTPVNNLISSYTRDSKGANSNWVTTANSSFNIEAAAAPQSPTTTQSPPPQEESSLPPVTHYRISETKQNLLACRNKQDGIALEPTGFDCTKQPYTVNQQFGYKFQQKNPGPVTLYVDFIQVKADGTEIGQIQSTTLQLGESTPLITGISCSADITGKGLAINIKGRNFGQKPDNLSVIWSDQTATATVNTGSATEISAVLQHEQVSLADGTAYTIKFSRADGSIAQGTCSVGGAKLAMNARMVCRAPSTQDLTGVEFTLAEAKTGGQVLPTQTVTIDKNGVVQNLDVTLTPGACYRVSVKAPNKSVRRTYQFQAQEGTTNLSNLFLPIGDIAPVGGDGRINTADRSDLIRQWGLTSFTPASQGAATTKTGDFNNDGVINSYDFSCMVRDFNASDDPIATAGPIVNDDQLAIACGQLVSTPTPSPSQISSPTASISPSASASPFTTSPSPTPCIGRDVLSPGYNDATKQCKVFPNSCMPDGWTRGACPSGYTNI